MTESVMSTRDALSAIRVIGKGFKAFEKLEDVLQAVVKAEGGVKIAEKQLETINRQADKAISNENIRKDGVSEVAAKMKHRDDELRARLIQTRASMKEEKTKLVLEHDVFITNLKNTTSIMKEGFETEKAEKQEYLDKLQKQIDRAETKIAALRKEFA